MSAAGAASRVESEPHGIRIPGRYPVAAIVTANRTAVDGLLADFALGLRKRGWQVRGIVQQCASDRKEDTVLIDLDDGMCFPLFRKPDAKSRARRVDTRGIAAACIALRRALHQGADLTIANRFGVLEASGGGLSVEMLALMREKMPLLTVVPTQLLDDWQCFSGGCGVELEARLPALEDWFSDVSASHERQ